MSKTAVIYCRHASGHLASHFATRVKAERCRDMAQELGAEIVQEFTDHGVSGTRRIRPGFGRVLHFIEQEPVDYVICAELSDLGRHRQSAVDLAAEINNHGAQLAVADQNVIFQVHRARAGHGASTDPQDEP